MLFHSLPDTLLVMLFALLLGMAIDGLARFLPPLGAAWGAPGAGMARLIGWLRDKLNRAHRSEGVLRVRGMVLTLLLLTLALLAGWVATRLAGLGQGGILVEIAVLARLLAAAPVLATSRRLRRLLLTQPDPNAAARAGAEIVRGVVRRDALMGDAYGVTRAMIETLAEASNITLFAPLLAYATFGLPGALALRLFALQAWRWRMPAGTGGFSDSARSVWVGLARVPMLLAAPLIALAALLLPAARGGAAGRQWLRHPLHPSLLLVTFGAALGVSLGGPRPGRPNEVWQGGDSARPTASHLRIAARLFWLTRGLALIALSLLWGLGV